MTPQPDLNQFIDVVAFTDEVSKEITDITGEMSKQTGRVAFYGAMFAKAQTQASLVELTFKSVEAKLMTTYRQKLEDAAQNEAAENKAPVRITVDMVKSATLLDPHYLYYAQRKIQADEIQSICRIAYDAFKVRRDMLVSMGHINNAQLKTNTQIMSARQAAAGYSDRRSERDPGYTPDQQQG